MDEMDQQVQAENVPASLEEAMLQLRNGDTGISESTVGTASMGESTGTEGFENPTQESTTQGKQGNPTGSELEASQGSNPELGGYPDGSSVSGQASTVVDDSQESGFDYAEIGRSYIQSAQQMAIQSANQLFKERGYQKISTRNLAKQNDRGQISFYNPDDPERDFSSRAEAQAWVDAYNHQVEMEWRDTVQHFQNKYAQDIQPTLRVMSFAPEYDAMTPTQQKVFDQVVEEYALKDQTGMTIGYSCDLQAAKRMALNICKNFDTAQHQGQQTIPQQQLQGGGPALDAKTSNGANPQNNSGNPKDIAEAFKMVMEEKKASRKK